MLVVCAQMLAFDRVSRIRADRRLKRGRGAVSDDGQIQDQETTVGNGIRKGESSEYHQQTRTTEMDGENSIGTTNNSVNR